MAKKVLKKLPEKFKENWMQDLRSGNLKQGKNYLKCGDTFCCLGVAYNMRNKSKWAKNHQAPEGMIMQTANGYNDLLGENDLPAKIMDVFNQDYNNERTVQDYLAFLNDNRGWKFPAIANWIEKNL